MIWEFIKKPIKGEVFNVGGGIKNSWSIIEAIDIIERISKKKIKIKFIKKNRIGDHIWYISNLNKFKKHYPNWKMNYSLKKIISEIILQQLKMINEDS